MARTGGIMRSTGTVGVLGKLPYAHAGCVRPHVSMLGRQRGVGFSTFDRVLIWAGAGLPRSTAGDIGGNVGSAGMVGVLGNLPCLQTGHTRPVVRALGRGRAGCWDPTPNQHTTHTPPGTWDRCYCPPPHPPSSSPRTGLDPTPNPQPQHTHTPWDHRGRAKVEPLPTPPPPSPPAPHQGLRVHGDRAAIVPSRVSDVPSRSQRRGRTREELRHRECQ